jgi:hypothetical protein
MARFFYALPQLRYESLQVLLADNFRSSSNDIVKNVDREVYRQGDEIIGKPLKWSRATFEALTLLNYSVNNSWIEQLSDETLVTSRRRQYILTTCRKVRAHQIATK